ncbi:MAG: epimerase, partial [Ginsengibacter sp.]
WIAEEFGKLLGQKPSFINEEESTALLSNASEAFRLFGYPKVCPATMMQLLAEWIKQGGKFLNKDSHFQEREGQF